MVYKTVKFTQYEETITNLKNAGWGISSKSCDKAILKKGMDIFYVYASNA